jgi:ribonuclease E
MEPDQPDAVTPEPAPEPAQEPAPAEPVAGATDTDGADDEAVPAGAGPDDPGPMDAEPSDAGTPDSAQDAGEQSTEGETQPPVADDGSGTATPVTRPRRRRAASRPAGPPAS